LADGAEGPWDHELVKESGPPVVDEPVPDGLFVAVIAALVGIPDLLT
jgi:hypothetical protein